VESSVAVIEVCVNPSLRKELRISETKHSSVRGVKHISKTHMSDR